MHTKNSQQIQGRIERIVPGGHGLLRTEEGVVFCAGVIPGELISCRIGRRRRGVAWASDIKILEPSPERREPPCPHYASCGGCDFMHMTYAAELEAKRAMVEDALRRIGRLEVEVAPFDERFQTVEPYGYRNSVRLQGSAGKLGFCRKETEDVVAISDCLIAAPEVRAEIRCYVEGRAETEFTPSSVTIRAGSDSAVSVVETAPGMTRIAGETLRFELLGRHFHVSPASFFQVNTRVAEWLIADLRVLIPAIGLPASSRLLDLFAGVGTFAISLSNFFGTITGYEIAKSSIEDFRINACDLPKIGISEWNAANGLKEPIESDDIVIVDPPRAGLPDRLTDDLASSVPRALIYISCNAATLARDLKKLVSAGYHVEGPARVYDMFPRTSHVETLVILKRN